MSILSTQQERTPSSEPLRFSSRRTECPVCHGCHTFAALIGESDKGKCFSCNVFIPPVATRSTVPVIPPPAVQRFVDLADVERTMDYLNIYSRILRDECTEEEERAAIYEYLADMTREEAERLSGVREIQRVLDHSIEIMRDIHPFAATVLEITRSRTVLGDAMLGMNGDRSSIFWYRNQQLRYVNAKRVLYSDDGFSRDKSALSYFLYRKDDGYGQCLFGEEQLSQYWCKADGSSYLPTAQCVLVESEKSALLARYHAPEYIWLATGGANGLTLQKAEVLRGRNVLLLYDEDHAGAAGAHASKRLLTNMGINAMVMDPRSIFPRMKKGYDVADHLYETVCSTPR
jgi:hypothetical protein